MSGILTPTLAKPDIVQIGNAVGTGTAGSLTLPTGLRQGDIVFVISAGDGAPATTITGYTIGGVGQTNSAGWRWAYKYMGSVPDTTVSGLGTGFAHLAFVFRGVKQVSPFDVATPANTTAISGLPNPPAITTVSANAMIVILGFVDDIAVTGIAAPSTYTLIGSATTDATAMAARKIRAIPGSDDPAAFTGTGSDSWVGVTIALCPI